MRNFPISSLPPRTDDIYESTRRDEIRALPLRGISHDHKIKATEAQVTLVAWMDKKAYQLEIHREIHREQGTLLGRLKPVV